MQLFVIVNELEHELYPAVKTRAQLPSFDGVRFRLKGIEEPLSIHEVYAKPSETNFGYTVGCMLAVGVLGMFFGAMVGALIGMLVGFIWGTIHDFNDLIAVKKFNNS